MDNQQQDFNIKPFSEYPKILVHIDGYLLNSKTGNKWYTRVNKCGYVNFQYVVDGKKYTRKLHKVIAECFVPRPEHLNYTTTRYGSDTVVVKHKDNNKLNNHYSNLEWGTNRSNIQEAHRDNLIPRLIGEQHGMCKMTEEQVHRICQIYFVEYLDKKPPSCTVVANMLGLTRKQVSKIRYKATWKHITDLY